MTTNVLKHAAIVLLLVGGFSSCAERGEASSDMVQVIKKRVVFIR